MVIVRLIHSWAEARKENVKRICINPKCGWVGKEADCMDYKHPVGARLCPECYEVTEEIRPTKRPPDGAKRTAQKGSISGKRSVGSPRR